MAKTNLTDWIRVGTIGVDAGLCWLGDPCYILHKDKPYKAVGKDWSDFCNKIDNSNYPVVQQFNYDLGHEGLGFLVSSGLGDGSYNVYVKYATLEGWGKRVAEVKVVFLGDEDEEDEENEESE